MAYKRKSSYRRRTTKRRKGMSARSVRKSRVPSTMCHSFVRKSATFSVQGNAAHLPYTSANNIQFNQVADASDFTALYDQYRINMVKLQFYLRCDPSAQTAATAFFPKLYWARDMDDGNAPLTLNTLKQYHNCKIAVLRPDRPVTIWVKPNVLHEVFRGVGTSSYSPKFGQWIDMLSIDLQHFGIKYAIDIFTNTNYFLDIEQTFYFQCKNPR